MISNRPSGSNQVDPGFIPGWDFGEITYFYTGIILHTHPGSIPGWDYDEITYFFTYIILHKHTHTHTHTHTGLIHGWDYGEITYFFFTWIILNTLVIILK